ncbi:endonuclease/exonuclease/phosphatase family protein [Bacteroidales bacterium OttesenSCG-928-C03]|nr:endonuclease/exonuclease/phosphatase family protein [Bacteroidales bacterium OttesenSCG-928-C03]MDL2326845.1 endonuclease/exonuclease/phosphatase family protein [Bacteroidales bacterium OttesenSCG-928-A14]
MGKNGERTFFGKILIFIAFLLNIVVAVALLFAFLAQFISPNSFLLLTYCGLAFPYLAIANLVFVVFWLFINRKYSLLSLLLLLLNINNIDRSFQFSGMEKPQVCDNCVKVMSYNAQLFGLYNAENKKERNGYRDKIIDFIRNEQPDIVCFQEYFYDHRGDLDFNTTDSVFSAMKLSRKSSKERKSNYATFFPVVSKSGHHYGLAIFSKYKIIQSDHVAFADSTTSNGAMFVDIKYKNDTVRVYSVHLESFRMDEVDQEIGKMILNSDLNDPDLNKKALQISNKMGAAFKKRAHQAEAIRAHIDQCPYPVIVCGDFNDTPVSYSYKTIGGRLKDVFRVSGKGNGVTYNGDAFPTYRIDYIFHSRKYNSYGYETHDQIDVSDHFPISTYISVKKR